MARFVKIIISVLILVFSFSCKKELTHYYVSDAFKRWTVFNKGSYWIFVNDSTSAIDSVFVKAEPRYLDIPPYSSKDNFTLEWIELSYSSAFFSPTEIVLKEGGGETFYMHIYNTSMYTLIASSADKFIPYYENINEGSTYQLLSQDSVFYLGAEKFYNVVSTQRMFNGEKWTFWFAKDIGLIKVSGENTNSDFTWSLLRYHIVK
jgi:hypothetical protein